LIEHFPEGVPLDMQIVGTDHAKLRAVLSLAPVLKR
jgi:hypothetical protein